MKVRAQLTLRMTTNEAHHERIRKGSRASVYVMGQYYPAIVSDCPSEIEPGKTGQVELDVIGTDNLNIFRPGTKLELRSGIQVVAVGTVLSDSAV
jgi:hypothetical protein